VSPTLFLSVVKAFCLAGRRLIAVPFGKVTIVAGFCRFSGPAAGFCRRGTFSLAAAGFAVSASFACCYWLRSVARLRAARLAVKTAGRCQSKPVVSDVLEN